MKKHREANKTITFATNYNIHQHGIILYKRREEEEELK